MNENLNLVEILKNCPKWTKLYSIVHGDVEFIKIEKDKSYPIVVKAVNKGVFIPLTKYGKLYDSYEDSECILFPSKTQRDWRAFHILNKRGYIDELHPFSRVLVRNDDFNVWHIGLFEYIDDCGDAVCDSRCVKQCVPYNDETKALLGTADDCMEYYKYWEEGLYEGKII